MYYPNILSLTDPYRCPIIQHCAYIAPRPVEAGRSCNFDIPTRGEAVKNSISLDNIGVVYASTTSIARLWIRPPRVVNRVRNSTVVI